MDYHGACARQGFARAFSPPVRSLPCAVSVAGRAGVGARRRFALTRAMSDGSGTAAGAQVEWKAAAPDGTAASSASATSGETAPGTRSRATRRGVPKRAGGVVGKMFFFLFVVPYFRLESCNFTLLDY
jgi:hypothetical protein